MNDKPNPPTEPSGLADRSDPQEPSAIHDPEGETQPDAPMEKPRGEDGFGLWYRFFFRFQYTLLHIIGPPRLSASMDPRTRMKQDYERRKALRQQWNASRKK